jgi:hypothetical protein
MSQPRYLTAFVIASLLSPPVSAATIYAYLSADAGSASDFRNVSTDGSTTGIITLNVGDTAGGGSQTAVTSGYATVGALGGRVLASTSTILQAGQGFNDLNWATDFFVNGAAGSTVSFLFSHSLDGYMTGTGANYSGLVNSTVHVGGTLLGDFKFDVLVKPGPFSALASQVYTFSAGDIIHLSGRMTVSGRADQTASVDINAFNTAAFYVDVLTPGAGYTTDAGVAFPTLTSVPEPPTFILCLIAFVARTWKSRLIHPAVSGTHEEERS